MGDFDKLGFEVEVEQSSFDTTISRLDTILNKLSEIQDITNKKATPSISVKGVDTSASSKKSQTAILQQKNSLLSLEKAYESYSSATGRWENAQASLQTATTNLRVAEERYNEALRNPLATIKEREKALRSLERAQASLTKAQNNADIAEQNVGNAQRSIEQRENSYASAELRTQRALLSEIDKFQERISRNEQLQTSTGYQQALEKQVKLLQDKKLLLAQNESKTIGTNEDVELRALQLQNEERRKAVDLEIKRNGALSEGFKNFSESGQLNEADKKVAKDKGEYQAYLDLQKLVEQEERLNSAWSKQIETLRLLNQEKQKKLTYDIISNDSNVRAENVATKIAQLNANTAVSADLAASAEGRLALEEKARVQYGQQLITQMATLQAKQEAINNGKYEEARRIELANKQRQTEIDQRLKQELGIKNTTNALTGYIAKLGSVTMIARKMGQVIAGAIQEQASFVENLNLFSVTFGEMAEDSYEWAINLADSFALSRNEVIKTTGLFKQLATSIGIADEAGTAMSKTLTQLGYDFASFYNKSTEQSMQALQAGIFAGQMKTMRANFGIDISEEAINNLLKTNAALAQFDATSRELSQSDKTIARLILTMKAGSNAFNDMGKTINTLQNQIRVFQGSMSNFKLVLGEMFEEPIKEVLVIVNAFIISITNALQALSGTNQKAENNAFKQIADDTKEANEQYEEFEKGLASFDKFNVLQSASESSGNEDITNALLAELEKQTAEYESMLEEVENRAKEIAKNFDWAFVSAGSFLTLLSGSVIINSIKNIKGLIGSVLNLNKSFLSLNNVILAGAIGALVMAIKYFQEGNIVAGILASVISGSLVVAWALMNKEMLKTIAINIGVFFKETIPLVLGFGEAVLKVKLKQFITYLQGLPTVLKAVGAGVLTASASLAVFSLIINAFDEDTQPIVAWASIVVGAIVGITTAVLALKGAIKGGLVGSLAGLGVGAILAGSIALSKKSAEESFSAHADGGYTNANLIMTHENGKREWVGKAAGSAAIVNDTQMSDIMETAVAKGVYRAFSNSRTESSSGGTTKNVYNFQVNGKTLLSAMEDEARKQGKKLARY